MARHILKQAFLKGDLVLAILTPLHLLKLKSCEDKGVLKPSQTHEIDIWKDNI